VLVIEINIDSRVLELMLRMFQIRVVKALYSKAFFLSPREWVVSRETFPWLNEYQNDVVFFTS